MTEIRFVTREIGSLAKPGWRVKAISGRPVEERDVEEAQRWGERLGVELGLDPRIAWGRSAFVPIPARLRPSPKPASNGCRGSRMSWTLTGGWGRGSLKTTPDLAIRKPDPARFFAKSTFT